MYKGKSTAFILAAVMAASVSAPLSALPVMAKPSESKTEAASETKQDVPLDIEDRFEDNVEKRVKIDSEEDAEKVVIPDIKRDGYTLKYWSNKKDGSGKKYNVGDTYVVGTDPMLYAIWEKDGDDNEETSENVQTSSGSSNELVDDGSLDRLINPQNYSDDDASSTTASAAKYDGDLVLKRGKTTLGEDKRLVLTCRADTDVDVSADHQNIKPVVNWDESQYDFDITTNVADSGNNKKTVELKNKTTLNLASGKYADIAYKMTLRSHDTGETVAEKTVTVRYKAK